MSAQKQQPVNLIDEDPPDEHSNFNMFENGGVSRISVSTDIEHPSNPHHIDHDGTTTTGRRSPKFSPHNGDNDIPSLSPLSLSSTIKLKPKKVKNFNAIGKLMDEEDRLFSEYEEKANVEAAAAAGGSAQEKAVKDKGSAHEKAVKDKGNVFNCCFTSPKAENEDEVYGEKSLCENSRDPKKLIPEFFPRTVGYNGPYQINMLRAGNDARFARDINLINLLAEEEQEEFNELIEIMEIHDIMELQLNFHLLVQEVFNRRAARVFYHRRLFHNPSFVLSTGFTRTQAENFLLRIGHRIRRPTSRNWAATTPQIFLVALRMLRTGADCWNCGMFVGLSKSTAHRCFWQFVNAVVQEMSDLVSLQGTDDQWKHQAQIYHGTYGISHVGSIDGTYIKIRNIGDRTNWRCRKRYAAINMQIFVDASGLIRFVSCRLPGTWHDSMVYRNTDLFQIQRTGPGRWQPFPDALVLADSAYIGIPGDNLLLPHPRQAGITAQNAQFYLQHRRARNNVETTIGRLKGRFGILSAEKGGIKYYTREKASRVIKCCAIMYNFLRHQRGLVEDSEEHAKEFGPLDPHRPKTEQIIEIFYNDLRRRQQQQPPQPQ